MAGGRNKKGREQGRRISVWELQAAALTDRPDLLPRYAEYMRAIKGVNWLRWSQGLRQFCGIVEESDKEILERGEAGRKRSGFLAILNLRTFGARAARAKY